VFSGEKRRPMATQYPITFPGRRGTIHHVGVSGGKDSTALLLWAKYESGVDPAMLRANFSDTGNEAEETYAYVRMLSEKIHPIEWLTPPLDFWQLAASKKRFPSVKARFCTQLLKMVPTQQHVLKFLAQGYDVLMLSGVRAAESADRAKLPQREPAYLSYFGCEIYRPLLHWPLADVWAIHKRYRVPPNPLYAMGCKRVGCLPCIMSRKSEIAHIARRFPERIELIRKYEQEIESPSGYASMFHWDRVPDRYRSRLILTRPKKVKALPLDEGKQMDLSEVVQSVTRRLVVPPRLLRIATIDDVVRWALNDPDYFQEEFEEVDFGEDAPACDSRYGACE
jgi:3'-phosphoadenosine 5'-phosphosulfate sulfotransferase (PAPS reductase)/FAD synthetase